MSFDIVAFAQDHVILELGVANTVAFEIDVAPDGRQQPLQRFGRGLFPGQPDAHRVTGKVIVGKLALDLEQAGGRAVTAEIMQQVDIVGCTHYPLLTGIIQLAMGDNVTLVSSAEETAKDVLRILTERDELAPVDNVPTRLFESTGDAETFSRLAQRFLGPQL